MRVRHCHNLNTGKSYGPMPYGQRIGIVVHDGGSVWIDIDRAACGIIHSEAELEDMTLPAILTAIDDMAARGEHVRMPRSGTKNEAVTNDDREALCLAWEVARMAPCIKGQGFNYGATPMAIHPADIPGIDMETGVIDTTVMRLGSYNRLWDNRMISVASGQPRLIHSISLAWAQALAAAGLAVDFRPEASLIGTPAVEIDGGTPAVEIDGGTPAVEIDGP